MASHSKKNSWQYAPYAAVVVLFFGAKKVIDLTSANENEKKLAPLIAQTEQDNGIPSGLLHRLLKTESAFLTDVITGKRKSSVGALGIAQFMPATAKQELGSVQAALDPELAIKGAGRYLKKLYNSLGKDWTKAVAAYNWGIGNVKKKTLANAPDETRKYLAKIMV